MRVAKIPPDLRLKDIPCISDSPLSINPLRTNVFLLKRAHGQETTDSTYWLAYLLLVYYVQYREHIIKMCVCRVFVSSMWNHVTYYLNLWFFFTETFTILSFPFFKKWVCGQYPQWDYSSETVRQYMNSSIIVFPFSCALYLFRH